MWFSNFTSGYRNMPRKLNAGPLRCLYTLIHDSIIYNYPKVKKKKSYPRINQQMNEQTKCDKYNRTLQFHHKKERNSDTCNMAGLEDKVLVQGARYKITIPY